MAVLARLIAIDTAYDLFIDEITYTNIAINVAHGHGVTLYGQPFDLHPPAGFGLFGLAILVFGFHGGTESVLFNLRHVAAVARCGHLCRDLPPGRSGRRALGGTARSPSFWPSIRWPSATTAGSCSRPRRSWRP